MQSIAKMANSRPRLRGIINYLPQWFWGVYLPLHAPDKCSVAFLIVTLFRYHNKSYNENPTVFNLPKDYPGIHL